MAQLNDDTYGLSAIPKSREIAAPDLEYLPRDPRRYRPGIGLIGCGGVSVHHLAAYKHAGFRVVALCDRSESKARERRAAYYPDARTYIDYLELLKDDDVEVVDTLAHPADRAPIMEAALKASKHVLSQKPFALDLNVANHLVELADHQGVKLAVNQNGRWAPHFAYLRQAVAGNILGELTSAVCTIHWDHSWVAETPFNELDELVLYDFAIHWFDIVSCFFEDKRPRRVLASTLKAAGQRARSPMLAHVLIDYEAAIATLSFDGTVVHGQQDCTCLAGTNGSAVSVGPSLSEQRVTLYTADGLCSPSLQGTWFREGFRGAMAELLCSIEDDREPSHSARNNLRTLDLTFASIASAHSGGPVVPGTVDRLPAPRP